MRLGRGGGRCQLGLTLTLTPPPHPPHVRAAQVVSLADLLDKMLALEPEKRLDPDAALRHPFVKQYLPKKHHHGASTTPQ